VARFAALQRLKKYLQRLAEIRFLKAIPANSPNAPSDRIGFIAQNSSSCPEQNNKL